MSKPKGVVIVTGYGGPGGSSVAHVNLCNLFNEKGLKTVLVSPEPHWASDKCNFMPLEGARFYSFKYKGWSLIYHFLSPNNFTTFPGSPGFYFRKRIVSCHETDLYPIKNIFKDGLGNTNGIHMVSESQWKWHGSPGKTAIIPNVISDIQVVGKRGSGIAGIIGSVDRHKNTAGAVDDAVNAGFKTIKIIGHATDSSYLESILQKYRTTDISIYHMGHIPDKNEVYRNLDTVFHASQRETFNYIKFECEKAGVNYCGRDSANSGAEAWDNDRIYDAWLKIL